MSETRLILALNLARKPNSGLSRSELKQELEQLSDEARNQAIGWLRSLDGEIQVETPQGPGRASPYLIVTRCNSPTHDYLMSANNRPNVIAAIEPEFEMRID